MSYKKIPLSIFTSSNSQLEEILKLPFINESLRAGGIISGGFVRQLLKGNNLLHYLSERRRAMTKEDQLNCFNEAKSFFGMFESISDETPLIRPDLPVSAIPGSNGDIDIFFQNESQIHQVIGERERYSYLEDLSLAPSITKLCANIKYKLDKKHSDSISSRIKIQLVSHFYGKAEDILETFDFTNIKCAIDSQFVYFDDRFHDLEKNRQLDVKIGSGPLTGGRILKYLNNRQLTTITRESRYAITEWAIRFGGQLWGDHPLHKIMGSNYEQTIKSMIRDERIFTNEDLLHLVGKIQLNHPVYDIPGDKYSISSWTESDLAIDTIAERSLV
jgi:hypothetical protein